MKKKKSGAKMDVSLLILLAMVLSVAAATFFVGGWPRIFSGLSQSVRLADKVWLRLLLGFALGGMVHVLIPRDLVAKWLGPTSGLKGIFIGSYIGLIITGAPYVRIPIIASIYSAGAGVGPIIAFLAANGLSLQGLIVWQIPFLGLGVPLARFAVCLFIPPIVGLAGAALFKLFPLPTIASTPGSPMDSELLAPSNGNEQADRSLTEGKDC